MTFSRSGFVEMLPQLAIRITVIAMIRDFRVCINARASSFCVAGRGHKMPDRKLGTITNE